MTEEIIIDDIDVSKCEAFIKTNSTCYNCYACKGSDCYYKQRERKAQENEKLKKEVKQIGSDFIKKGDYARALEQENKELKEWKDKVVKLFESACRCKYLNEETDICSYTNKKCININKCVYKYQELSDTYRSALEEIKRYTEERCRQKVLDKINEVLK